MDVLLIETYALPNRPTALGHLGTVIVSPPNSDGEYLVKFTLSRKGARRMGLAHPPKLDKSNRKDHNAWRRKHPHE